MIKRVIKRLKKAYGFIKLTGLWIIFALLLFADYMLNETVHRHLSQGEAVTVLLIGGVLTMYIWSENLRRVRNGMRPEDIGVLDFWLKSRSRFDEEGVPYDVKYPPIREEMLFDEPCGVCFGKDKRSGKWVCKAPDVEGHVFISGGTGSAKSQAIIIPFLLLAKRDKDTKCRTNSLVIDIKGELQEKLVNRDENGTITDGSIVFDVRDRDNGWGYDPLYQLKGDNVSSQLIYETFQLIILSIIPMDNSSQPYWVESARSMALSCFIFAYKYKDLRTLPEIIEWVVIHPIKDVILEILYTSTPDSPEFSLAMDFNGLPPETLGSVYSNMSKRIMTYYNDEDLYYALCYNVRRFKPDDLLQRDVYCVIPLDKMDAFSPLTCLILNQVFRFFLGLPDHRDDPERARIAVVFDEAASLMNGISSGGGGGGKCPIQEYPNTMRLVRSKGVSVLTVTQSRAGLRAAGIDKEVLDDLLSSMKYKVFLDSDAPESDKYVVDASGKYEAKQVSWNVSSKGKSKTISFQRRSIVDQTELKLLPSTGEAILISSVMGYCRIKKTLAWNTTYFQKLQSKLGKQKG